mmetsp:Transcript_62176/g.52696  ORF Transcript_62176/g.52696 Transcript_62176/m.52696 type:complete len:97 (-) Transcript_62176:132-422(-)
MMTFRKINNELTKRDSNVLDENESIEDESYNLQTNTEALMNLLNNDLGSGMLASAYSFSKSGIAVGLVLMLFCCILQRYTLLKIMRLCDEYSIKPS